MKFKSSILFLLTVLLFSGIVSADPPKEGMWIPLLLKQLNESDMQSMGMKLSAEDIYSINKSSLKDAIVQFGGGCTGSIISEEGLLLTNHHCGYGAIQSHSSVENDYLTDGFWAMSREEELANPSLTAMFIVEIRDVTQAVLEGVTDEMEEAERSAKISQNQSSMEEEATKGTHYEAQTKPFFGGNEFYMFITETFRDVRMVGAPPSSIGKFGGDTDNWMWPRHTGDFSLFRVYAGPDNKPADYSEENVPYKPKHFLPIGMKGVDKGDFTMVFGFPGRTTEYLTSHAVDEIYNVRNPASIDLREKRLSIMDKYMQESDKIRIQYSAKYFRISNYYKKWIGENRGLKKLDAIKVKIERENAFQKWADADVSRSAKYGDILAEFERIYTEMAPYADSRNYLNEAAFGIELVTFAWRMRALVDASTSEKSAEALNTAIEKAKNQTRGHFKNYHAPIDREIMEVMLKDYSTHVDAAMLPSVFQLIKTKFKGDFGLYTDYVFKKSMLVDQAKMDVFLASYTASKAKKLEKDPGYALMQDILNNFSLKIRTNYYSYMDELDLLTRKYVQGLREMSPNKTFYADANSTLRIGYGQVDDYHPADGVFYKHYTTMEGMMEKYDPSVGEFDLPDRLIELYEQKDFGPYAHPSGEMRVCFTASNHTTGGNSGSPLINGEGHLAGLNFDRNWEGTMSDIMYDPDRCRNISVDIKYILFVVDKFAGATHLIKEMKLIK